MSALAAEFSRPVVINLDDHDDELMRANEGEPKTDEREQCHQTSEEQIFHQRIRWVLNLAQERPRQGQPKPQRVKHDIPAYIYIYVYLYGQK